MKDTFVIPRDNIISYIEYWKEGDPIPSKKDIIRNFDLIHKLNFSSLQYTISKVIWNSCRDFLDQDKVGELICVFSRFGEADMVQELLNQGAHVHVLVDFALRLSSENGHLEVVKLLLYHGANVHTLDDWCFKYAKENVKKYLNERYVCDPKR